MSVGSIGALPRATVRTSGPDPSAKNAPKAGPTCSDRIACCGTQRQQGIAAVLGTIPVTVGLWRQRILDMELAGLQEAPKTGRPKTLPAEQVQKVLSEVARSPKGRTR
jgi:hypothetical protein